MSAIIRWTFPLIAYLCVGTVVSALLGYGYLRSSGKLNDETMFRIMALVHGVDLDKIAEEGQATVEETPPEEPSFAEQKRQVDSAMLHYDAKRKQLDVAIKDFNFEFKRVTDARERYDQLKKVVEDFLKKRQDEVDNEGRAAVRAHLEALIPRKQAKPILIKFIEDGRIDEVILLLSGLKPKSLVAILRTFDTPDDVEMLFQIQQHMLDDNPAKPIIDAQLDALNQLKAQDK